MKTSKLLSLSVLTLSVLLFTNCQTEDESVTTEINQESSKSEASAEVYPLTGNEKKVTKMFFGEETEFNEVDNNLILGDMILSPEQVEETNILEKGVIRRNRHWPKSGSYYYIPYTVDSNLPNKGRVTSAINHWESKTKIRFVKRTNQRAYIRFRSGSGCSSSVGRTGGRQNITLASGCSTGNTIHEIGHAIGMYHEQQHPKRDNYVTVNFNNIQSGKASNFNKRSSSSVRTSTFDIGSIMMYGSYFFSKNGKPTIVRKNGSTFNVQRRALSSRDLSVIKRYYK
ncbi:M12 family metallopeptidase [Aquimarina megaterium]|uniref:M12 family metallopeptidase n=1 Tax=Aquimarina megaterium TaxID=1443666 RepID=UPI0004707950|nr:M12 family metallopeptidase [Aquimarina megaterium]